MKSIILHILCEGPTEERFVKEVLSPYFRQYDIVPKPILLETSRKKNARGGIVSYLQVKRDLAIMLRRYSDNEHECHLFTTMIDYYALPNDFPAYEEAQRIHDIRLRISSLESEFAHDIAHDAFIPYIQLHEFEALLFTDITKLEAEYRSSKREIALLKKETDRYGDPEMINDGTSTAPSKRIIKALEKHYNYNKVKSGAAVTARIGLERLLADCRHFREWIELIQQRAK